MSKKPEFLNELIERASKAAGSDYKLAQLLETSRQTVSNWKHGHKTCPVGDVALMAEIAGLEPEAWTARAVIAQYSGSKGEKIARALGKALVATGAVIATSGASAGQIAFEAAGYFIRCIKRKRANVAVLDLERTIGLRHMGPAPYPRRLRPG